MRAVRDGRVLCIPGATLREVLASDPALKLSIWRRLAAERPEARVG